MALLRSEPRSSIRSSRGCVYHTVRGTTRRTNTVKFDFPVSCKRDDDPTLWDSTLTLAVNACLGMGFLCPYCIYRKYLSVFWLHPVNICCYLPYFLPVFIMAVQLQPSAGRGLRERPRQTRPPLDRRRVEREGYFPCEWAVTPAGQ